MLQVRRLQEQRLARLQQQHGQQLDGQLSEVRDQLGSAGQLQARLHGTLREFGASVEFHLQRCAQAQAEGEQGAGEAAAGMLAAVTSQAKQIQQRLLPAVAEAKGQLDQLQPVAALPEALLGDDVTALRAQLAAAQREARAAEQRAQAAEAARQRLERQLQQLQRQREQEATEQGRL